MIRTSPAATRAKIAAISWIVLLSISACGGNPFKATTTTLSDPIVPDLIGVTMTAAQSEASARGLVLEVIEEIERVDVPPDTILEQMPTDGTVVVRGSRIQVNISVAPAPSALLELVDVVVTDPDNEVAVIDIRVKNDGDQVAFISAVEFSLTGYQFIFASGQVFPSAVYDSTFPISEPLPDLFGEDPPRIVKALVSQSVDPVGPGAIDRFVIRIAPEPGGPAGFHDFEFLLRLIYDGDSKTEDSEIFNVRLGARNS